MTRVEMKRQLKALAERDDANVIRISFDKDNKFTIATMYMIDKKCDLIFKKYSIAMKNQIGFIL